MQRLTKTYEDGTFGVADNLPCGENSHNFKDLLIQTLGKYETSESTTTTLETKVPTLEETMNMIKEYVKANEENYAGKTNMELEEELAMAAAKAVVRADNKDSYGTLMIQFDVLSIMNVIGKIEGE